MGEDRALAMPKYRYKPLDDPAAQIRLLCLEPGDPDDLVCLKGTLSQHRLADRPAFVALSYEWGNPEPVVDFRLNGKLTQIRYNLWALLNNIVIKIEGRKIPRDTRFWVDAICINQADLQEKNAQVALMGKIYSSASLVFAWLGHPISQKPQKVFEYLLSESRILKSKIHDADYQYRMQRSNDFENVVALSKLRYWTRRWVLQELFLPEKVIVLGRCRARLRQPHLFCHLSAKQPVNLCAGIHILSCQCNVSNCEVFALQPVRATSAMGAPRDIR